MSESSSSYVEQYGDLPFPETPSQGNTANTASTSGKQVDETDLDVSLLEGALQESSVDDANARIVRRLQTIINGISAPFCCGGTVRLADVLQIMITKPDLQEEIIPIKPPLFSCLDHLYGRKNAWEFMEDYLLQQSDILRPLIDNCPVAAFGKGNETVVDGAFRQAPYRCWEDLRGTN